MMQVNLSTGYAYHTQRNNRLIPGTSCGATMAVMALKASGWSPEAPEGIQLEDHLTGILTSPEAFERRDAIPGTWADNIPPNQIHAIMAWGINRWMGKLADVFTEHGRIEDMIWRLFKGTATGVNGVFAKYDHQVAVVGFSSTQHERDLKGPDDVILARVVDIIIDDPYGDYRTDYSDHNGNDIHVSLDEFDRITHQRDGPKWQHVFERGTRT